MSIFTDLSKISQITNNIFVSGICPLNDNSESIKKLNIKYILSCLDRKYVSEIHNKIIINNPDITILYLPYDDNIEQNLWIKNKNSINIVKCAESLENNNKLARQVNIYNNKPMIEIGYHYINNAVIANENILIHCMAGISRSISITVYYLMKKYYASYDTVINYIKNKRMIANPNNSFRSQLLKYQNKRDKFTEFDANNIIISIKHLKHI